MDASSFALEDLLAKLFIARPDVKAYQAGPGKYQGQYFTHVEGTRENPTYIPWTRKAIQQHLAGEATYGHYLLSKESNAKLFAFDIDLQQIARLPHLPVPINEEDMIDWESSFCETAPREAWKDRRHPARDYMKFAMRTFAHKLQREIDDLGIPSAVAYTGSKGVHVYGFTGLMPAKEVRAAAMICINNLPIKPVRGNMIYEWEEIDTDQVHHHEECEIFTVEVFPKQDEISEEGFGNLMRLPLGKNQKSNDPTFFVDTNAPMGTLAPTDPHALLSDVLRRL
jgi:hypothetical protein